MVKGETIEIIFSFSSTTGTLETPETSWSTMIFKLQSFRTGSHGSKETFVSTEGEEGRKEERKKERKKRSKQNQTQKTKKVKI
jgi:hypothetical protein